MGYDNYHRDDVTEYLAVQRQRIAELEAENRALWARLDALCRGEGVAVLINGQRIPLAALTEAVAGTGVAGVAGERPYAAPGAVRQVSAPQNPYHHPAQRVPLPTPQTPSAGVREDVFPEAEWITGATPAMQPPPQQPAQRGHNAGARALRPSEHITPQWLREAHSQHSAATPPAQQPARHYPQHAWPGSYGQPRFATLAQITGQNPAVRPQRRDPQARNPYADSYVLD